MPAPFGISKLWNGLARIGTRMEIATLEADRNLAKSGLVQTAGIGHGFAVMLTTKISDEAAEAIVKRCDERLTELNARLNPQP